MRLIVGIFVGGRARRFGGIAKGLLKTADGRPIIERTLDLARQALPGAPVFLVGDAGAYGELGLPQLNDIPAGIGPLGGLSALLRQAREADFDGALALACDMPALDAELLGRLAHESAGALALAPRPEGGPWSALSARYATGALPELERAIADGERAFQRLFARLGAGAAELPLTSAELERLIDWDRPEDVRR